MFSALSKHLTGRVVMAHGGTIGVKVTEFKMAMSKGYNAKKGIPSAQEIAQNIDKVLIADPDLEIMQAFKFD